MQATPGIEPAPAWQSPRGELLAQFNITGDCHKVPQSRAGRKAKNNRRLNPKP
jgi:hypothetical protein